MALTVIPKDSGNAHRKPAWNTTHLPRRDGTLIGPELPDSKEWSDQTKEWYDMWRRHELAPLLEETDWAHLQSTALLVELYWSGEVTGSAMVALSAEIRRCVASYGATVLDRLKLRIQFTEPEKEDSSIPKSAVDYSFLSEDLS